MITMEFYTKIVGVNFENTGANTEHRQSIIHQLFVSHHLEPGQELSLEPEFNNIYDCNAIKVVAPDGRQIGYLSRQVAENLALQIRRGQLYRARVASVTGGTGGHIYGINISVEHVDTSDQIGSKQEERELQGDVNKKRGLPLTPAEEVAEKKLLEANLSNNEPAEKITANQTGHILDSATQSRQCLERELIGSVVKDYDTGKEYVITKVDGENIEFANGWSKGRGGTFLRYYKFIDFKKRDVFESLFSNQIAAFHADLNHNSPYQPVDEEYTPPSIETHDFFYDEDDDWGPDSLSESYYDYHEYD